MNRTENRANSTSGAHARQKDKVLREVMPKLGMEPTDPDEKYKTATRKKRMLSSLAVFCVVVLLAAAAALFLLTPCKFLSLETAEESYTSVTVDAQIGRTILLDNVTAELNGQQIAADQQSDPGSFRIEALSNGTLTVTARTVTGRETSRQIEISGIDRDPPKSVKDERIGNSIYIYLEDEGSGVNWDSIEVTRVESGDTYKNAKADEADGVLRVRMPDEAVRIYAEDMAGNHLSLRLEPAEEEEETADDAASAAQGAAQPVGTDNPPTGGDTGSGLASSPFAGDSETAAP